MFNDKDLDILIDTFFPLDWDKKNYKFNREEKDMHPYTIKYSEWKNFYFYKRKNKRCNHW